MFFGSRVRGQGVFDVEKPNFAKDYAASVDSLPVPVVTHEIGQYAVYPDLKEIDLYTGVLDPLNFKGVKLDLERKGLLNKADDYLMASGKLAAILYKEEMERAMKTPGISGFQLLDLHDFPGQGTALVGLLNAFWESKGVTTAEEFRRSCAPVVPLARFPKAVYTNNEVFTAELELANYGDVTIEDGELVWSLTATDGAVVQQGSLSVKQVKLGGGQTVGRLSCQLSNVGEARQLQLRVALKNTDYHNSWNVWVYPAEQQIDYGEVVLTTTLAETRQALEAASVFSTTLLINSVWDCRASSFPCSEVLCISRSRQALWVCCSTPHIRLSHISLQRVTPTGSGGSLPRNRALGWWTATARS